LELPQSLRDFAELNSITIASLSVSALIKLFNDLTQTIITKSENQTPDVLRKRFCTMHSLSVDANAGRSTVQGLVVCCLQSILLNHGELGVDVYSLNPVEIRHLQSQTTFSNIIWT